MSIATPRYLFRWVLLAFFLTGASSAWGSPLLLTGSDLKIEDVVEVARHDRKVALDPQAMERVKRSYRLVLRAADEDIAIYGLNRGVGLNKDKVLFSGEVIDPQARAASEKFNHDMLQAHAAGVGPPAPEEIVRAAMVVRLNTALLGHTGAQPEIVRRYSEFLNFGIHPVIPSRGSMGEADITLLSHIGLAMMGKGEVDFQGRRIPALDALRQVGLEPVRPFGKDGLAIISSNAFSAGWACLVIQDAEQLLETADEVYALSLEGFDGNVAPLLEEVQVVRKYPGQFATAERIRSHLQGSYLWEKPDPSRQLQDPLSFRCVSQVHGAVRATLVDLREQLTIQLNSSDDNPAVILDIVPEPGTPDQVRAYFVPGGAVIPTANFEPLSWVLSFETLGVAMAHVSHMSAARTTKLGNDHFTGLTRFLAPDEETLAYSAIQKAYVSLDSENRALARPVSLDYFPVAGGIEDHATNSLLAVQRMDRMIKNLRYILGMELMHGAQALDLRRRTEPQLKIGVGSQRLFGAYRKEVPFLDRDRILTYDIQKSYQFLNRRKQY